MNYKEYSLKLEEVRKLRNEVDTAMDNYDSECGPSYESYVGWKNSAKEQLNTSLIELRKLSDENCLVEVLVYLNDDKLDLAKQRIYEEIQNLKNED